ncbi:hypothetical protein EIP91_009132 [Steccherinum ochraceum]|uniref:F-box domain-containing protein n=1 Tax=Steccherinum ochraceum TaxID=92696 RepID=A0A4R0RF57_9APHY|nr:hypothetical protein EIP91_009132 [Steccherinum ochraceum]
MNYVVFSSRRSATSLAHLLRRFPELRQRIKRAKIWIKGTDDQSWVSCVPFLLPLQLDSLSIEDDVDLSLLHPAAVRRLDLLRVKEIALYNVVYTRYSQISRCIGIYSEAAIWQLSKYDLSNCGFIRGKQTALKQIEVCVTSPTQFVHLLRNFTISSCNPLELQLVFIFTNLSLERKFTGVLSALTHQDPGFNLLMPAFENLPEDHEAFWKAVRRVWHMRCCRSRRSALFERLSVQSSGASFTLSRVQRRTSSDTGSTVLEFQAREIAGPRDVRAYASEVFVLLSSLEIHEVKLIISVGGKAYSDRLAFQPLDDALSHTNFATLLRVTLRIDFRTWRPRHCITGFM